MFNKRNYVLFVLLITIIFNLPLDVQAKGSYIDQSLLHQGVIILNQQADEDMKVRVAKGKEAYTYDVNEFNKYPLQFGNGSYTITVLEKVTGNKYRSVTQEKVKLELKNNRDVYLQSIQLIQWDSSMDAMKKAKNLIKGKKTDTKKVEAIYDYVVDNVKYDKKKAKTVSSGYLPSIDEVFTSNKGICFDYASLFAGMLRSVGVPTKLVMGYNADIDSYHAWNEVFIEDINEWIIIDTTYDASAKTKVSMSKKSSDYIVSKTY